MATSSLTAATAKMPEYQEKSQFKITDLNPHLSCILCGGYFIDATTITECLHSFCRACIVRYLETSKYCPVCEVQIHKTRPLRCIRSDKMLQDIVYKLVPGLYQNEMKRRRELYASQPPEALKESRDAEDRGEGMEDRFIYTADEIFHLSVDYVRHNGSGVTETVDADTHRRFLKCPAALTIFHLKKFIRLKYSIPNKYQVDLRYQEEEPLNDTYSLMDIAYIFAWKRKGLLSFSYRINEKPKKLTPRLRVVKPLQPEMKKDDVLMDSEIMPSSDSTAAVPVVSDFIKCDTVKEKTVSETTTHSSSATDHEEDVISNSTNNPLPESPKVNLTPIVSETPKPIVEKATKVYSGKSRKTSARSGKESSKRSSKKSHSSQSASAIKRSLPKICVSFLNNNSRRTGDGYTSSSIAIVPPTRVRSSSEKKASVPPPKVPKLTIPLTPKILQDANSLQQQELQQQQLEQQDQQPEKPEPQQEQPQRLQQDEEQQQQQQQPVLEDQDTKDDEKMDSDRDLFDGGPLVIAEPLEDSVESKDHKLQISDDDAKEDVLKEADKMEEEIDVESCEVDSGRGSDTSCRTGDDDIGSPGSSTTVRTPDLDKSNPFPIPSPSSTASLPSPVSNMACHSYNIGSIFNGFSLAPTLATTSSTTTATTLSPINGSMASSNSPQNHQKDDLGVLDLSTCHRKRGHDRLPVSRPRQVANPPVLDKHRQTTPCLPLPSHPSFKLLPAVLPHTSIYKKNTSSDFCRGNFRCKGSTLTAYNPDPNSNRPKIVIKSIESPRAEHGHGRHHHHHGHHHSHHHQRM